MRSFCFVWTTLGELLSRLDGPLTWVCLRCQRSAWNHGVKSRTVDVFVSSLRVFSRNSDRWERTKYEEPNCSSWRVWRKNTPNRRKKAISCPKKARKRALLSPVYKGGQSVCLADGMDVIPRSSLGQTTNNTQIGKGKRLRPKIETILSLGKWISVVYLCQRLQKRKYEKVISGGEQRCGRYWISPLGGEKECGPSKELPWTRHCKR